MNAAVARELFTYDAKSGAMNWRVKPSRKVKVGDGITTVNGAGYIVVGYRGVRYLAHRIIWLMQTGDWPQGQIDHINHDRTDNRWSNLRDVSHEENARNKTLSTANRSGATGVMWDNRLQKWVAYYRRGRKATRLGTFVDFNAAVHARRSANAGLGFHENHGVV